MTHDAKWYARLAELATERALDHIRDNKDAGAELSLASLAWDAVMGIATADQLADLDEYEVTDDDDGYAIRRRECICPADLLARGGFRGGCPVHSA